jgi:hypothetical protein
MHQLTIGHDTQPGCVSDHADFDEARQALLKYVVAGDYYLRPVQNSTVHASYELLRLADLDDPAPSRDPVVAGVATIEAISRSERPVAAPYFVACDAMEGCLNWHGDADELIASLQRWSEAGASYVSVNTMGAGLATVDDHLAALARAAEAAEIVAR